jgi:hypothetical protein
MQRFLVVIVLFASCNSASATLINECIVSGKIASTAKIEERTTNGQSATFVSFKLKLDTAKGRNKGSDKYCSALFKARRNSAGEIQVELYHSSGPKSVPQIGSQANYSWHSYEAEDILEFFSPYMPALKKPK